jgi:beta-glucosidase
MPRFDLPSLIDELTLEEKAALVSGSGFWHTRAIGRVDLPSIMVADGPHGLRKQPGPGDHVGAGRSVPATCFPTAAALGSSWDVDLVREVGEAIATEARAQGVSVVLGPGINIKRSPLCGRNFEYLSEDPVISGVIGAALVSGIQSRGVGTSLKHFAVNNQETDRLRVSAVVDERTLREIYLAGFERVVRDAGPWTVMCSYNRINGVYASQDRWLLTDLLRGEWGFDGLVMSDWGAVDDPVAAVAAGLDLEMPSSKGASARRIVAAVRAADLDEAVLDTAIGRLVGLLERALLERALPEVDADESPAPPGFDADAHHALARRAAAEGVVLLKNDGDLLPLDPGPAACGDRRVRPRPRYQGAGSSKVNPTRVDDALTELRTAVGEAALVTFAPGFGVDDPDVDDAALLAEAVEAARGADTVLVFLGLPASEESEGFDRTHIDLPATQLAVLDAVAAVNPRVVVVLANGGVVAVHGWERRAPAILEAWLGGQAGGGGVVDVLLGTVNPAGRLTETIPRRLADTPAHLHFPGEERQVHYGEGVFVGYRHHDAVDGEVSYPFGHGLSYTTFATPISTWRCWIPTSHRGGRHHRAGGGPTASRSRSPSPTPVTRRARRWCSSTRAAPTSPVPDPCASSGRSPRWRWNRARPPGCRSPSPSGTCPGGRSGPAAGCWSRAPTGWTWGPRLVTCASAPRWSWAARRRCCRSIVTAASASGWSTPWGARCCSRPCGPPRGAISPRCSPTPNSSAPSPRSRCRG